MAETTDHTAEAAKQHAEATKKRLAEEQQAREKARVANPTVLDSATVKPTPTQSENDLAASGVHVVDHEADGSPTDEGIHPPTGGPTSTRQVEAGKPAARGSYPTRASTPSGS